MTRPVIHPRKLFPVWPAEDAISRMRACVLTLAVHGLISESEARNVRVRIDKWRERYGVARPSALASAKDRESFDAGL